MTGTVTIGYAVKSQTGEIDVRTVCPTFRGAQVNGLCVSGWHVASHCTDEMIAEVWEGHAREGGQVVVMVEIREKERADG